MQDTQQSSLEALQDKAVVYLQSGIDSVGATVGRAPLAVFRESPTGFPETKENWILYLALYIVKKDDNHDLYWSTNKGEKHGLDSRLANDARCFCDSAKFDNKESRLRCVVSELSRWPVEPMAAIGY